MGVGADLSTFCGDLEVNNRSSISDRYELITRRPRPISLRKWHAHDDEEDQDAKKIDFNEDSKNTPSKKMTSSLRPFTRTFGTALTILRVRGRHGHSHRRWPRSGSAGVADVPQRDRVAPAQAAPCRDRRLSSMVPGRPESAILRKLYSSDPHPSVNDTSSWQRTNHHD